MKEVLFTLYEKSYHLGVAGLVNSLAGNGFCGEIIIGYRDALPPWIGSLKAAADGTYKAGKCTLRFMHCNPERHLGFHKPFFASQILQEDASIDSLYYADPDILVLTQWKFFQDWIRNGIALCGDINFSQISALHPWRNAWAQLVKDAGRKVTEPAAPYANSGFFGLKREHQDVLEAWMQLTLAYEQLGGDTSKFSMNERANPITGDQDILAAALMSIASPCSYIGAEAMGFGGYHFILSHGIESPKAWGANFIAEGLKGKSPSTYCKLYYAGLQHPIQAIPRSTWIRKMLALKAAMFITRFWRRG